jgi:hypothetical protein
MEDINKERMKENEGKQGKEPRNKALERKKK